MANTITSDPYSEVAETLLEHLITLTAATEEIRSEVCKIRAEIDQVLEEVRSLPHGNEWARHG